MPPGRSGYAADQPAIDPDGYSSLDQGDQPTAGRGQRLAPARSLLQPLISPGGGQRNCIAKWGICSWDEPVRGSALGLHRVQFGAPWC